MRIVIAGGGTGGHLFPGIAIAEEFLKRDDQARIIFIGTKKGIESKLLGQLGYELREIDIEGVKGRGIKALVKGAYQIPQSIWQSRSILKQFQSSYCCRRGRLRFRTGSAGSPFYENTHSNRGTKCHPGYH